MTPCGSQFDLFEFRDLIARVKDRLEPAKITSMLKAGSLDFQGTESNEAVAQRLYLLQDHVLQSTIEAATLASQVRFKTEAHLKEVRELKQNEAGAFAQRPKAHPPYHLLR